MTRFQEIVIILTIEDTLCWLNRNEHMIWYYCSIQDKNILTVYQHHFEVAQFQSPKGHTDKLHIHPRIGCWIQSKIGYIN